MALVLAGTGATAAAQCPPQWLPSDGFDLRSGGYGWVSALVEMPNGDLIAGGSFTTAGGVPVNNIARWNGAAWSPLGAGIQGGSVSALAALPNGDLIAGGHFTTAGGSPIALIARWDGSAWTGLGAGVAGPWNPSPSVRTLAVSTNGNLIVGGSFMTAGSVAAQNVAQWNGTTWSAIGTGLLNPPWTSPFGTMPGPPLVVTDLAVYQNGDIIAGTATPAGYIAGGGRVARWNGTNWSFLFATTSSSSGSSGNGSTYGSIYAVAALPNGDVVAAGDFVSTNPPMQGIAQWNGTTWSPLGSGISGVVKDLAVLPSGDLVAAGDLRFVGGAFSPTFAQWDGSQWSSLGGGADGSVYALAAPANGPMVLGGNFTSIGSASHYRLARWGCDTGFATTTIFGSGCYRHASSFYEQFVESQSFDLGGSTLRMSLSPTGYDVAHVPGPPNWLAPTSAALPLGDDELTAPLTLPFSLPYPGGTTNQIHVCSNGFVFLQPPTSINSAYGYGDPSAFLADAPRHAAMWRDLDPTYPGGGAGTIHFEVVGNTAYATWLDVQEYGVPGVVSSFQIAMSANGDVEYRYLALYHRGGVFTGWTPGFGAQDPTDRDISATSPFVTTSLQFQLPLQHGVDRRPTLGASITLTTSNVPTSSQLGGTALGWTKHDPGIDLSSLGMPGCFQFVVADALNMFVPSGGLGTHTLTVPNDPALVDVYIHSQGFAFVPGVNALGAVTSNGLDLRFGTL